ncbi:ADP-ribosylglycohydrolase family protein [Frigoribacterium sp. PhB24]|uniref:ADP-ribosylglycohydrolase family protein n=1 Tax=Frigoribacterium sp. PhB24 TaxID=2485204 RepID=UPI000FAD5686|nr:ADP-ribosylglycohydrolase family protein [Frigoribacterium sp. PhB24]ROS48868.1 ADP-ribosylglycohydrolase [Frigoribacterium sp. PhB24]
MPDTRRVPVPSTDHSSDVPAAFRHTTFDPLEAKDLLFDEILQRRESGYDVDDVVARAATIDPDDREAVLSLVDEMATATRRDDWSHHEPDALEAITATWASRPVRVPVDDARLHDQLHAAWLGRIAGCNVGKPVEMGSHWTVERIRDYLELADAYPLDDYFPVIDPTPEGFELRDNWTDTLRGLVDGSARDDDIDYPILALHLLEQHGTQLHPRHVGDAWLELFPIVQVFTAERAAYINLVNGVEPPETATHRNPYREWIGALIRGDVFGYVNPGDPATAAEQSYQDASLSHVGNGIYGEMWAAALVASAFVAADAREAIDTATLVVPPASRLAEAITHVVRLFDEGASWDEAVVSIREHYGHYSWVHTINNAALIVAGLLWGEGDYMKSLSLTVMGGWDTDSNGATVGSVAGILHGTAGLPARLVEPLHDRTRSALFGYDHSVISDLAERTHRLAANGLS